MKHPIFVFHAGSLDIFETVDDAERYIETPDIHSDPKPQAFDRDGLRLTLSGKLEKRKFLGILIVNVDGVTITSEASEESHEAEFRKLLMDHMLAMGRSLDELSNLSLEGLAGIAVKTLGFTR
jgi:hypothetical protein